MKLFPKMELAVKAMALCCPDKNDDGNKTIHDDSNKSPIARSEVFNETWMLRLTLALIHDCVEGFEDSTLARIHKAVTKRWISEGGLAPTLKNEGPTWTDAIIGDVSIETDKEMEDISGNKRGVKLAHDSKDCGVIVIEAKIGSKLARKTTHHSGYNQAARNIACLAQLIMDESDSYKTKCAFIVLGPREKAKSWEGKVPNQDLLDGADEIIQKTHCEKPTQYDKNDQNKVLETAGLIVKRVISWEEIIESMQKADTTGACETLKWFYEETCAEYGIKPSWSKT